MVVASETNFLQGLESACEATQSLLCIGLDPDPLLLPMDVDDVAKFNRSIIEATASCAAAYKPNLGFYEALGREGWDALKSTVESIRELAPSAIIIGDAKRGDIGPTAKAYARAMFEVWEFDAVTLNAWGGRDTVKPFLAFPSKGAFIWCRGSNPGSADFQDLQVCDEGASVPMYRRVAMQACEWNKDGNLGLCVGATVPEQLADVRATCPEMPLLIPGVGAQGGDLEESVRKGVDKNGRRAVVNSSRSIIYASNGADYAQAAWREAERLRNAINAVLVEEGKGWP